MKRYCFYLLLTWMAPWPAVAQDEGPRPHSNWVDLMIGVGSGQTNVSTSYQHAWKFGARKRLLMGVGMRLSGFFASDKYFVTAPAKIVKGEGGPGALFKKPIEENMDSVHFSTANTYALNFMLNIRYSFTDRFSAGFNIDLVGVSFGKEQSGTYINGNDPNGIKTKPTAGAPTGFNLLLIGENDLGSLNSEFFVAYRINERWSVKAGVQHIFMEYTTTTKVQQFPESNDRFRITPTTACAGIVYTIH